MVSIHASSREDATLAQKFDNLPALFQSTRPRGRTRLLYLHQLFLILVSIHASSREDATLIAGSIISNFSVSIHASSREDATITHIVRSLATGFNPRVLAGGRDQTLNFKNSIGEFQSTRPRGRTRPEHISNACSCQTVSIHASSREDATIQAPEGGWQYGFNPRVLAGGRDGECRKQYKSKCYICKSAKEIILIINEEQYHFS